MPGDSEPKQKRVAPESTPAPNAGSAGAEDAKNTPASPEPGAIPPPEPAKSQEEIRAYLERIATTIKDMIAGATTFRQRVTTALEKTPEGETEQKNLLTEALPVLEELLSLCTEIQTNIIAEQKTKQVSREVFNDIMEKAERMANLFEKIKMVERFLEPAPEVAPPPLPPLEAIETQKKQVQDIAQIIETATRQLEVLKTERARMEADYQTKQAERARQIAELDGEEEGGDEQANEETVDDLKQQLEETRRLLKEELKLRYNGYGKLSEDIWNSLKFAFFGLARIVGSKRNRRLHNDIEELGKKEGSLVEQLSKAEEVQKTKEEARERQEFFTQHPFFMYLLSQMSPQVLRIIFNVGSIDAIVVNNSLEKDATRVTEGKILRRFLSIRDTAQNTFQFSLNGFTMRLLNKATVQREDGLILRGREARYNIVGPNNEVVEGGENLGWEDGLKLYSKVAQEHFDAQRTQFEADHPAQQTEPDTGGTEEK